MAFWIIAVLKVKHILLFYSFCLFNGDICAFGQLSRVPKEIAIAGTRWKGLLGLGSLVFK